MVAQRQTDHDNVVDITGDGEQVSRELLFARKYVQDIDLFPELQVRLTRIFGPGVERDRGGRKTASSKTNSTHRRTTPRLTPLGVTLTD
jgi:hypothetical protein